VGRKVVLTEEEGMDGIDASRNFAGLIRFHCLHAQVRQDTGLSPFLNDLAEG
jgi:hypothetical protein